MGRGEFQQILEECLSALLEGRRGVEESLSLYPAWRSQLEPLLRAAEEIAAAFDQPLPPQARERGLQRFLEAARVRRRLGKILSLRRSGGSRWQWAPVGLAAAIIIGAVALLGANLTGEDGGRLDEQVSIRPHTATPERAVPQPSEQTPLERVQEHVAVLEETVRQGRTVDVGLLEDLEQASSDLAESMADPAGVELVDRMVAVSVASKEYELLQAVQGQSSGFEEGALAASLAAAENVLEKLGATPEPEATASPEPTASPKPTVSPTATPLSSPSPTATAGSGAAPTPSPSPSVH
jgi:hypothetical protein